MPNQPKIHAMLIIYNEAQFIGQTIKAVDWCDQVVIMDGGYQGFPNAQPQSTDGTIEIIRNLQQKQDNIKYLTLDKLSNRWLKEAEAMKHIPIGDYILRLDGDEVLEGRHELLRDYMIDTNLLPLYQIDSYPPDHPEKHWFLARLTRHTPELKLTQRHLTMTNTFVPPYTLAGGRGMVHPFEANISFLHFVHYCFQRDEKRKQNGQVYDR